jgi:hypothetical protein
VKGTCDVCAAEGPGTRGRGRARVVPQRPHPIGNWKVVALRLAGAVMLWGLFSLIGVLVTHVLVRGLIRSILLKWIIRRADRI